MKSLHGGGTDELLLVFPHTRSSRVTIRRPPRVGC